MNNPFKKDCPCRQKIIHLLGVILFTLLMTSSFVYFSPTEINNKLLIIVLVTVVFVWLIIASMVRLILFFTRN